MTRKTALMIAFSIALLATSPASAVVYQVSLNNGNLFETKYEPVDASFDDSLIMFLTDKGNWVAIAKADVASITTVTETLGFGTIIDPVTILIGTTANDKMTPEEEAEYYAAQAELQANNPFLYRDQNYSMPTFSEPNTGGGIPIGFINQTTPPLGGAGTFGGSPANLRRGGGGAALRRGGGGGEAFEPITRNN